MPGSIIRVATIAIAIATIAAPTALARPADMQPFVEQASAKTLQKPAEDWRTIAGRYAATRPVVERPLAPTTATADSTTRPPLPGPPTWPVNPQPITLAPAAKVTDGGNGGVDWTTIALGLAGSLLAIGAVAGIASRTRRAGIAV